ncbi:MAG TPA: rhodanese-like domain-containing protein [Clostridiales bacterium]|nr:rhodanese-like domain-containing protein [Clostridiales bacterium]
MAESFIYESITESMISSIEESVHVDYIKITPEQAKEIINNESNTIILDVRTQSEYDTGHIKNAVLLPDYDVTEKADDVLPDKNAKILVYCRSGRRSEIAAQALIELGYTNVLDFGGIID